MGSVKLETRNEGRGLREWDYVPLSEPRVVSKQITERWKQDESFYPSIEDGMFSYPPVSTMGVFPFSEPIMTTYIDLDRQIQKAGQTKSEFKIVRWLMQGYSGADIADHYGTSKQSVSILLSRAVERIVDANNKEWEATYAQQK